MKANSLKAIYPEPIKRFFRDLKKFSRLQLEHPQSPDMQDLRIRQYHNILSNVFVIGPFYTPDSICLNIANSDRGNLYENVAFSILVLSTKKRYSRYLKRVCAFRKFRNFQSYSIENVQNGQ